VHSRETEWNRAAASLQVMEMECSLTCMLCNLHSPYVDSRKCTFRDRCNATEREALTVPCPVVFWERSLCMGVRVILSRIPRMTR
jgi:hypothetical protein